MAPLFKPGSEDLGADAFLHDYLHAVEVDHLLGDYLAAFAGLDLTVDFHQALGDQRGAVVAMDPRTGEILDGIVADTSLTSGLAAAKGA